MNKTKASPCYAVYATSSGFNVEIRFFGNPMKHYNLTLPDECQCVALCDLLSDLGFVDKSPEEDY